MSTDTQRASFAEAVLSLVTARERAAAIAGDLVEEGARDGRRYWLDLSSVALAFFFREFWSAPLRSLAFLGAGFVLWSTIYLLLRLGGAGAGLQPLDVGLMDCGSLSVLAIAYLAVMLALSNLLTGALLSLASRADSLNGCAPLAMFWAAAAAALPVADWMSGGGSWDCMLLYVTALPFLYVAPLLCGGALIRAARTPA